ncbi:MAG: hypothetical protein QGF68_07770, partial [Nitrospinota bacterium]|nr:hypothetical protein [Nitrospinota bacterium]
WIVPLEELIDDPAAERERVRKQLKSIHKDLERLDKNLSNTKFRERAPAEVVAENEARRETLADRAARLEDQLSRFERMGNPC